MKKCFILTSLLALTACATGGGNGVTNPREITHMRSALYSDSIRESDAEMTDMYSQILESQDGSPTIVRSATVNHYGKEYTSYDLNDVVFKAAALSDDFAQVNKMATLKFDVKNGEITGVFIDEKDSWGEEGIHLERNRNENNKLAGTGTFKTEVDVSISDAEYKSIAKKNTEENDKLVRESIGLKYSDFGVLTTTAHLTSKENPSEQMDSKMNMFFAGGYNIDEKQIDVSEQSQQKIFNGRAIGEVKLGEDGEQGVLEVYAENATLNFTDGKSHLTMPFYVIGQDGNISADKWYTVNAEINSTFTNDPNTNIKSLNFTDEGIDTDKYANYKFDNEDSYEAKPNTLASQGSPVIRDGFVEFYGDDGKPSEAVGTIKYMEERNHENRIGFEAAFGGKAQ